MSSTLIINSEKETKILAKESLLGHKRKVNNIESNLLSIDTDKSFEDVVISQILINTNNHLANTKHEKNSICSFSNFHKKNISEIPTNLTSKIKKENSINNIDENKDNFGLIIQNDFKNFIELNENENLLEEISIPKEEIIIHKKEIEIKKENLNILNCKEEINSEKIANKIFLDKNNSNTKKEKRIKNNDKDNLYCIALDLLNKYGKYQIKFSKENSNNYILKIKEVDIKDNYFENIEYAKKKKKKSSSSYTAPNYRFWLQRYYYYSKFDDGIILDRESWYSVTPEKISKYIAKLIEGKTVIDGFCGSGGNVIQFSKYCSKVYAIDISNEKLSICKNNCKVYQCKDNIEFIHEDFLKMKNKIKADYIFLSPPWGGTEYKDSSVYSIKKYMYPDITDIIRVSLNVANNILFFLPKNLDLDELFDICSKVKNEMKENSGNNLFFDIQILRSNNRIKALLIIFGHNIENYFTKKTLENFLKKKYNGVDIKNVDILFSLIKKNGFYEFFKEEYFYRQKELKGNDLSFLVDFFKTKLLI